MARWLSGENHGIYSAAARWREECLISDGALWHEQNLWTEENVRALDELFNGRPLLGEGEFGDKFDRQIADASAGVRRLAAETLAVHFFFTESVTQHGKLAVIDRVLEPLGERLAPDSEIGEVLAHGVGGPGVGFNTRRDLQLGFLIDFSLRAKKLPSPELQEVLSDPQRTAQFADDTRSVWRREMRQIVLHLLHPDYFERISSAGHKRLIAEAFQEFVDDPAGDVDDDARLLQIRKRLEDLNIQGTWPSGHLDFYWAPLEGVWRTGGAEEDDQTEPGDTGAPDGISLVEALEWRKQAILYGPPGTSKTYRIRSLVALLVRRAALREWGAKDYFTNLDRVDELARHRIEWLQLHPGYSYEEFVRGLRIKNGETRYEPGVLLRRIEKLNEEALDHPDLAKIPWVLVLDEVNRTDLSRLLGEAFSMIEPDNRGKTVTLPGLEDGRSESMEIPVNLFIVGTMNLIDQSVEQVDFALRRRFHWHPCSFSQTLLLQIIEKRLQELETPAKHRQRQQLLDQLAIYADRAQQMNARIAELDELGEEYEIGHTIFADIARPLHRSILGYNNVRSYYLWDRFSAMSPLWDVWRFQLRPLLDQYLGSLPATERHAQIDELRSILLDAPK